jgi:hypothetical protein
MVGWNKIGRSRGLSNHRELLNHVVDVNSLHKNNLQSHVVHSYRVNYLSPIPTTPHFQVQILEFTYYNGQFPQTDSTRKLAKYESLQGALTQQG